MTVTNKLFDNFTQFYWPILKDQLNIKEIKTCAILLANIKGSIKY